MKSRFYRPCLLALACILGGAASASERAPLFESDEVLKVRIDAPFDTITRERSTTEYLPGKLVYQTESGEPVELDIGIRARGQFRRRPETCDFPPLRLNFKKSQVENTVFAGQDKLKLVTHCKPSSYRYTQGVLTEYIEYRILNLMTDFSFRVRLLEIEYATTGTEDVTTAWGVLIEHQQNLGERIGFEPVSLQKAVVADLDRAHVNLTSVFQYLIGNTDFSQTSGGAGDECCHNYKLFGAGEQARYSIPYDFDMSGMVDAPYAAPNPKMKLESVTERLYRGRCANNDLLPSTLQQFQDRREDIENLVETSPGLASRKRSELRKYLRDFYKTISSERRVRRYLEGRCR